MNKTVISFTLGTSSPAAHVLFQVLLNDHVVYSTDSIPEKELINIEVDDADAKHELTFVLAGKRSEHTQIDENNNIINDLTVDIADLAFEGIPVGHNITNLFTYTHDHNGTGQLAEHKFYNSMGCNGSARLKFSTPIYLWLLENM